MTDTPPDRLSTDPASPFYNEDMLARGIGIRFKGVEKTNVEEYCVSEGWVRLVGRQVGGPPRQADDDEAAGAGRALFPRGRTAGGLSARRCR